MMSRSSESSRNNKFTRCQLHGTSWLVLKLELCEGDEEVDNTWIRMFRIARLLLSALNRGFLSLIVGLILVTIFAWNSIKKYLLFPQLKATDRKRAPKSSTWYRRLQCLVPAQNYNASRKIHTILPAFRQLYLTKKPTKFTKRKLFWIVQTTTFCTCIFNYISK